MKKSTFLKLAMIVALMVTALTPAVVFGDGSDPWVAGIQVANLDTQPATITIEFYNTSGTLVYIYVDSTPIAAGDARTYYDPSILPDSAACGGSQRIQLDDGRSIGRHAGSYIGSN